MDTRIQILPEILCNKIAAGEVVERPASVVKELLENALDAGGGDIRIDVEKGGKRLIRVSDDGIGMSRDDIFLALERHATSKIRSDEDLFKLNTLGFRGEALPSIASVSRMTLRSCPEKALEGWEIVAEGGTIKNAGAVGMAHGTSVEARDLFFNTPGRRKFLRRDETELGHVADVVTRLALGRPQVKFRLTHNGRAILEAPRQNTLKERVASLLGRPLARDLLELEAFQGENSLELTGLIGQPALNRSTTGALYTFINGRYIRDRVVQHAVLEGYRNLLEKGRYPVVVLFLDLDPALVDVNVHPTKHEVRFQKQKTVHDFIAESVRNHLRPSPWIASPTPQVLPSPARSPITEKIEGSYRDERSEEACPNSVSAERLKSVQESLQIYGRTRWEADSASEGRTVVPNLPFKLPPKQECAQESGGFFANLNIIGQFSRSYILAEDGNDLILIDQHAAHERIGFERLKKQWSEGNIERQSLLFPVVLETDFREADLLLENAEELQKLGFEVEPFGGKTLVLKSVPRILTDADAEKLVRDVAGELSTIGVSGSIETALDQVLITMACHSMVRANQRLSLPEIEALLRDLDQVDFGANCPHGRPVMKRIPQTEVERMFRRT